MTSDTQNLQQPWVDIHCHCLPGLDDGPSALAGAMELCRQLVAGGVGQVIATPHQMGRFEGRNSAKEVRAAVTSLQSELDSAAIPLRVHAGGEVRIDPGVAALLQRDQVLTLADRGEYLLLELPLDIPVNPIRLIDQLASQGISTVIAHAERYPSVVKQLAHAVNWVQAGAALQVNAGSLLGEAGETVAMCAWELLRRGMVSVVASDAHDPVRRKPRLGEIADVLANEVGASPARQLLRENPLRILDGLPIRPVVAFVDGPTQK